MADLKESIVPASGHTETLGEPPSKEHDSAIPINIENEMGAPETGSIDFRTVMACVALAFTYEACLFSFVLPSAILLTINADIGPSTQINWVATSWSLSSAVVTTIAGRCSDIFGRRSFFITGNLLGVIGCTVASRASVVDTVIAGSTLMGVGAGIQQLAFAASSEIVPRTWRGRTIALLNIAAVPGSAFGSVIAYALVARLSWRWAFYLGIITNAFALSLIVVFYWPPGYRRLHAAEGKTRLQQLRELDYIGLVLFGGGLTSFLLGVSWGGNPYPWRSAHVLAPLIIGALAVVVAFPLYEVYGSDKVAKLCPPVLFRNIRGFTLPLTVCFFGGMMFMGLQVLWPQEVQLMFTTVPETIGWYSLAYNAAAMLGGVIAGTLFGVIKKTNYQYLVITIAQTAFIASISSVTQHTPAKAIVLVAIAAASIGAQQCIGILILQLGVEDRHIGVATGLSTSVRSVGGAIAISIYTSIIQSQVSKNLAPEVAKAVIQAGLPPTMVERFVVALASGSFVSLLTIMGVTPTIIAAGVDALRGVYADAFKMVFLVSIAFGSLGCIAAVFVSSVDHKLTSHTAVQLDRPHLLGPGKGEAMVLSKNVNDAED